MTFVVWASNINLHVIHFSKNKRNKNYYVIIKLVRIFIYKEKVFNVILYCHQYHVVSSFFMVDWLTIQVIKKNITVIVNKNGRSKEGKL